MQNKILFISHEASRTGAPLVLLNFIKWLKTNTNIPFIILLGKGGALQVDFEQLGTTYRWPEHSKKQKFFVGFARKIYRHIVGNDSSIRKITNQLKSEPIGLIYANTIATSELALFLKNIIPSKLVLHVHELEFIIQNYNKINNRIIRLFSIADYFIAASVAVKSNLVKNHSINKEKIKVVYEFIEPFEGNNNSILKKNLGIPEDAFIVLSMGVPQWRKGTELLVLVAMKIIKLGLPIYFLWVGGDKKNLYYKQLRYDISKVSMDKKIILVDQNNTPYDYLNMADVFLMCSREDPFPLVNLEAGFLKKPIVCFDNAGGSPELLTDGGGRVVPYLDIDAMAEAICDFYNDISFKEKEGEALYYKVINNFMVSQKAVEIYNVIITIYPRFKNA